MDTKDAGWLGGVTMQRDGELAGKVLFFAGVGPTTALIAARDARRVGQSYPCRLPPIFTMPVAAPSRPQCDLTSLQSLSAAFEANVARSIDCVFYEAGSP